MYLIFFSNKTSENDPMHTLEAVFTTLPKSFRQKVENFSLISDKKNKNTKFFQKT